MTKWAGVIVFAAKKDYSPRFYARYHKLNSMIIQEPYQLPRMDERTDTFGEITILSTHDEK